MADKFTYKNCKIKSAILYRKIRFAIVHSNFPYRTVNMSLWVLRNVPNEWEICFQGIEKSWLQYYSFIKLLIVIKSVMAFCNSEDRPFYNVNNKFCSIDDTSSKRRIVRNAQHVINSWKTKFFSVIFKYRYLNMEQGTQLNSVFPSKFLPGQWTLIYKTKCM